MKCPYCRKKGAKIRPGEIQNGGLIHTAIDCHNPRCTAYNPVRYGFHPEMLPEKHASYHKYRLAVQDE